MSQYIHEQEASNAQQQKSSLAAQPILVGIMKWLTSLINLTEQEEEDAGIYIGRQGGE